MRSHHPLPVLAATIDTPCCLVGIHTCGDTLFELTFEAPGTPVLAPSSPLAQMVATQLWAWFDNPVQTFRLPLAQRGTTFQQRVWQAIAAVPRGKTCTYGTLAKELGSVARAVGQACRVNPFPIIIPCHRIVSATGIGGFAGAVQGHLIDTKQWLQTFEAAH